MAEDFDPFDRPWLGARRAELITRYLARTPEYQDDGGVGSSIVALTFMAPPAEQWAFIVDLLEAAPDRDDVLADIAAGPLEGLLADFVKTVLVRRTNLWLFRSNQRRSCGDFIAVDMSSSRRGHRRTYVMELKMGEHLVLGGARLQCAPHPAAVDELIANGILDDTSPVELLYGDGAAVLTHLGEST